MDLEPGSSISNLDVQDSDEDITSKEDSSFSSESSRTDDDLPADKETMHIGDISVGDFAVVKCDYSRSMKYYVGECMRKDNNGDIVFIFLERVCGKLFKYGKMSLKKLQK